MIKNCNNNTDFLKKNELIILYYARYYVEKNGVLKNTKNNKTSLYMSVQRIMLKD